MSQLPYSVRPSAGEERWLLISSRWPAYRQTAPVVMGITGWRGVGFLTRCAFFLLGLIVVGAMCAIFDIVFHDHFALIVGIVLWAVGEWLIVGRRLNAAGLEEALIVAAFVLLAGGLMEITGNDQHDISITAGVALALLLAGLRLLNPLFTTLAAIVLSFAISFVLGFTLFHSSSGTLHVELWISLYCYMLAIAALLLGGRQYQRPSYDRMLNWLVVVMPVIGYLWSALSISYGYYQQDHSLMQWYVVLMPAIFSIAAIVTGIQRRTHAPLFATMGGIACLAYELRNLTGMPLQWRLILWGSLLLVASSIVERMLRTPRHGITSRKFDDHNHVLDVAEMAGTALITPVTKESASAPAMEGGGGTFSGGGASGKY